jgi:hypothetical protein
MGIPCILGKYFLKAPNKLPEPSLVMAELCREIFFKVSCGGMEGAKEKPMVIPQQTSIFFSDSIGDIRYIKP